MGGLYTDPDGGIFGLTGIIAALVKGGLIGAGAGAASYSIGTAASGQSFDFGDFTKSIGLGLVGGALTGGATSLWGGVAGGAAGGAASGAINAGVNGGNIGDAIWQGALGGAVGGIISGASNQLIGGDGFIRGFTSGAIGGAAGGAFSAGIAGGNIGQAVWQGAAVGGTVGGALGYASARSQGLRGFTGKADVNSRSFSKYYARQLAGINSDYSQVYAIGPGDKVIKKYDRLGNAYYVDENGNSVGYTTTDSMFGKGFWSSYAGEDIRAFGNSIKSNADGFVDFWTRVFLANQKYGTSDPSTIYTSPVPSDPDGYKGPVPLFIKPFR